MRTIRYHTISTLCVMLLLTGCGYSGSTATSYGSDGYTTTNNNGKIIRASTIYNSNIRLGVVENGKFNEEILLENGAFNENTLLVDEYGDPLANAENYGAFDENDLLIGENGRARPTGVSQAIDVLRGISSGGVSAAATVAASAVAASAVTEAVEEKAEEESKKADEALILGRPRVQFSAATSTHNYGEAVRDDKVRITLTASGGLCGEAGFWDGTKIVDSNGDAYVESAYIKVFASYKKPDDSTPNDFPAPLDEPIEISGIYPPGVTVPRDDYMRNLPQAKEVETGYDSNGLLYLDLPIPTLLKTVPYEAGTTVQISITNTGAITDKNGVAVCNIGTNSTHIATLNPQDAQVQFESATGAGDYLDAINNGIRLKLDVTNDICGVAGFNSGGSAVDINNNAFNANAYITVKLQYKRPSDAGFVNVTSSQKLTGIYPPGTTVPNNDWLMDTVTSNFGYDAGVAYTDYRLPAVLKTAPFQNGTEVKFLFDSQQITDGASNVICEVIGINEYVVTLSTQDAEIEFATATSTTTFTDIDNNGQKVAVSFAVRNNLCGVGGFNSGGMPYESDLSTPYDSTIRITITSQFQTGGMGAPVGVTTHYLTGIYPVISSVPMNDYTNSLPEGTYINGVFTYSINVPLSVFSSRANGTLATFTFVDVNIKDSHGNVICTATGNTTHTITVNN